MRKNAFTSLLVEDHPKVFSFMENMDLYEEANTIYDYRDDYSSLYTYFVDKYGDKMTTDDTGKLFIICDQYLGSITRVPKEYKSLEVCIFYIKKVQISAARIYMHDEDRQRMLDKAFGYIEDENIRNYIKSVL